MKAILEFDLPDDNKEFRTAVDGVYAFCALAGIREELRNRIKYPRDGITKEAISELESLRTFFAESVEDIPSFGDW